MTTTVDDEARRATLLRAWSYIGQADDLHSHDHYHDDAVLEFPAVR